MAAAALLLLCIGLVAKNKVCTIRRRQVSRQTEQNYTSSSSDDQNSDSQDGSSESDSEDMEVDCVTKREKRREREGSTPKRKNTSKTKLQRLLMAVADMC